MSHSFVVRLKRCQSHLAADQAVLLSTPTDITYLTGFEFLVPEEREALLVITPHHFFLLHASFSPVAAPQEVKRLLGCAPTKLTDHLRTILNEETFTTLLIDKASLFVDEYEALEQVKGLTFKSFPKKNLWSLRSVKDQAEQKAIRAASSIAIRAFQAVQPQLQEGMTERQFKNLLNEAMRQLGSERVAFPTIVAFGPHSAIPHHQPDDTQLKTNTAVLCDFGATVDGYRSDLTRSWWFGSQPPAKFESIKKLVHQAYQAALDRCDLTTGPAVTAQQVDQAARHLISQGGFGTEFIHTTGHGVGLDIHEQPSLNWQNTTPLEPGQIITIEPGIYLLDAFGYRYENTVLVTGKKAEELTLEPTES